MKKRTPQLSIQTTLMIFVFSMVLILFIVVLSSYDLSMRKLVSEYLSVWSKQIAEGAASEIDVSSQYVDDIMKSLVNSSAMNQYIRNDIEAGPRKMTERETWHEMQFLRNSVWEFYDDRYLIPFLCLRFNGKQYTMGDISQTSIYKGLDEKIDEAVAQADQGQLVAVTVNGRELQLIAYHVSDLTNGQQLYEVVLAMDLSKLSTILADGTMGESGRIVLADRLGQGIYPSNLSDESWQEVQTNLLNDNTFQGAGQDTEYKRFGKWQVVSARTKFNNWYVVGYTLIDEISAPVYNPATSWLVPALALLGAGLFTVIMSRRISRPILHIVSVMKKAESSNFTDGTTVTDNSFRETAYISNQFNEMMKHIRKLISEVQKAEEEKSAAEFASLQAQIRPHFIYNTLENISMALIVRGERDISRLVMDLGEIMRYNISPKRKDVTLEEDVDHVEKYFHILKFRFGKKLDYKIKLAPETKHLVIEKLLIQPLVENSVVHGVGACPEGGMVSIESWIEGEDKLCIRIADDGVGFCADALPASHSVELFGKGGHIGLDNVRRRIHYRYGTEYGLRFESVEKGTSIVIMLPIVEETNEASTSLDDR